MSDSWVFEIRFIRQLFGLDGLPRVKMPYNSMGANGKRWEPGGPLEKFGPIFKADTSSASEVMNIT